MNTLLSVVKYIIECTNLLFQRDEGVLTVLSVHDLRSD